MPHLRKAELIEGIVYMPSPVSSVHAKAHQNIVTWLGAYVAGRRDVEALDNATLMLDGRNEVQPDACLMLRPNFGGQSRVNKEGYIVGAPELVAEISLSGVSIDLRDKKEVYLRNNVKEYLVWLVLNREVFWWKNQVGQFESIPMDPRGIATSTVFEGLRLNVQALLEGDLAAVIETVRTVPP